MNSSIRESSSSIVLLDSTGPGISKSSSGKILESFLDIFITGLSGEVTKGVVAVVVRVDLMGGCCCFFFHVNCGLVVGAGC